MKFDNNCERQKTSGRAHRRRSRLAIWLTCVAVGAVAACSSGDATRQGNGDAAEPQQQKTESPDVLLSRYLASSTKGGFCDEPPSYVVRRGSYRTYDEPAEEPFPKGPGRVNTDSAEQYTRFSSVSGEWSMECSTFDSPLKSQFTKFGDWEEILPGGGDEGDQSSHKSVRLQRAGEDIAALEAYCDVPVDPVPGSRRDYGAKCWADLYIDLDTGSGKLRLETYSYYAPDQSFYSVDNYKNFMLFWGSYASRKELRTL